MPTIPRRRVPPPSSSEASTGAGAGVVLRNQGGEEGSTGSSEGLIDSIPAGLHKNDSRFPLHVARMKLANRRHGVHLNAPHMKRLKPTLEKYCHEAGLIGGGGGQSTVIAPDGSPVITIGFYDEEDLLDPSDQPLKRHQQDVENRLWLLLVALEYLQRKRVFEAKLGLSSGNGGTSGPYTVVWRRLKTFLPLLILVLVLLYIRWPLWNILFDVETSNNYKVLEVPSTATTMEIKKAYRGLAKKWHPDQNPDCGMLCRNKMMEIQRAYDELIKMKRDHVKEATEREQQYQELLGQIIAFILYRGFDMAVATVFFAAFWLERFLMKKLSPGSRLRRQCKRNMGTIVMLLKGLLMLTFLAVTVVFVTGLQPMLIMMSVVRIVMLFRTAADQQFAKLKQAMRIANFDSGLAFVALGLPTVLIHASYFMFYEPYPRTWHFCFQVFYGTVFVIGHLASYAPNLFDNLRMMQCQVPHRYCRVNPNDGVLRVSSWSILSSELGFLADDLFAFATGVPVFYRVAVILIHACFIVEYRTLPREMPILEAGGRRRRGRKGAASRGRSQKGIEGEQRGAQQQEGEGAAENQLVNVLLLSKTSSGGDAEEDEDEEPSDDDELENQTEGSPTLPSGGASSTASTREGDASATKKTVVLSPDEAKKVVKLDTTPMNWMQIVQLCYPMRVQKAVDTVRARIEVERAVAQRGGGIGKRPTVEVKKEGMESALCQKILFHDECLFLPSDFLPLPPPPQRYDQIARQEHKEKMDKLLRGEGEGRESQISLLRKAFFMTATIFTVLALSLVLPVLPGDGMTRRQVDNLVAPYLHPQHPINNGVSEVLVGGPRKGTVSMLVPDGLEAVRLVYAMENTVERAEQPQQSGGGRKKKKKQEGRRGQ